LRIGVVENEQAAIHSARAAGIGMVTVGQLDVLSPLWALCQPRPERALKIHQRVMLLAVRPRVLFGCNDL